MILCPQSQSPSPMSNDGLCFLVVLRNTPPRTFWIRAILPLRQFWQTRSTLGLHSLSHTLSFTHSHSRSLTARYGCQPNGAIYWSRTGTSPDHRGSRLGNADHWWTHWSGSPAWTACYRDTESRERSPNRHNAGSCQPPGDRKNTLGDGRGVLWGEQRGHKGRKGWKGEGMQG